MTVLVTSAMRARAEARLDDTCVVTRAGDGEWTPEDGFPAPTEVLASPCTLLAAQDRRHDGSGGDDRERFTHVLTLPVAATGLHLGDEVTVASQEGTYVVAKLDERTRQVLQRVGLVASRDAEGVAP